MVLRKEDSPGESSVSLPGRLRMCIYYVASKRTNEQPEEIRVLCCRPVGLSGKARGQPSVYLPVPMKDDPDGATATARDAEAKPALGERRGGMMEKVTDREGRIGGCNAQRQSVVAHDRPILGTDRH